MTLDEVLAEINGRVSYLRAVTSVATDEWSSAGGAWWSCAKLIDDRAVLSAVIERTKDGFGTDDVGVAASLFTQAYAFRVTSISLAAHALGLPVPAIVPDQTAVRLDKPRPSAVALLDAPLGRPDASLLAAGVIGAHLAPFVAAVHDAFRVGERLLWGNVAASCAVVYRAVEGEAGDPNEAAAVRARAAAFVAAEPRFAGLGEFSTLDRGDAHSWHWDRTNCCLWYQTASGSYCDNCSLRDADEVREERLRALTEAPS
ncbi:MAG TPA: IucA/IucC family C-terminal-domain containing protein [Acidimicrobiia bacterium]|nr:IucA/IucC family C-terminal-domain containing protein [Acidimicrobiia bacterium]